ncbi:hypothetical protein VUR80DRAFT_2704 [Thermomyces stellatus]
MAPSSRTFLDRLSSSRKGPLLPLHSSTRHESDYDLEELEPQPTDGLLPGPSQHLVHRRKPRHESEAKIPESLIRGADDQDSSHESSSVLFAKPPPPIARSALLPKDGPDETSARKRGRQQPGRPNVASGLLNIGSVLFDSHRNRQRSQYRPAPDSIWQSLRRRERAIEEDLQRDLNTQAAALAGELRSASRPRTESLDGHSDAESSTPTATFYSTASSKSKMIKSLNLPTRSTPDGDVIPVRQPRTSRRPGIRTARHSLLRSMIAMSDFKAEEDACISSAVSQRKMALARLRKLAASQQTIKSELQTLDEDEEEPLGKELRDLQSQRASLTEEIKKLEERLIGLRNKRRWVEGRMDDVRNRREAGLSGYKGALREVEADIDDFLRHPSIKPLDRELWVSQRGEESEPGDVAESSPGGEEFLRLIPERRTLDMARSWWETEILILENRRRQVDRDREALEAGERLWSEVIDLVTDYETSIADLVKDGSSTRKGKEKMRDADDIAAQLLGQLGNVMSALEERLKISEENQWNLLICAIGAELDAFNEAERVLRGILPSASEPPPEPKPEPTGDTDMLSAATESPVFKPSLRRSGSVQSKESGNEVPQDLLTAPDVDQQEETPRAVSPTQNTSSSRPLERSDSENSVPPEFLAEHSDAVD